jgi:rod shape-determining protein MreD
MSNEQPQGGWVILASWLLAYVLTVMPLPDLLVKARPDWVALALIYWCMTVPQRVGVGIGWLVGLGQDALQASLLGQHALAYAVLAYLTLKLHQRIRVFPLWQQAITVMVLLLFTRLLLLLISGFTGRAPNDWQYWLAALTGTLLWPAVHTFLRRCRIAFNVR